MLCKFQNLNNSCSYNNLKTSTNVIVLNSSSINFKGKLKKDVISFCGTESINEKLYLEFIDKYNIKYPNIPLENIIKEIITSNEEINHGKSKKVFNFIGIEDYVIGYIYNKQLKNMGKIHQAQEMLFPKYYMGQPIAEDENGTVIIMKKIKGVPNSVKNHYMVLCSISNQKGVTKEISQEYLSKIRLLKGFPQESYDKLARQLIYINENADFVDFINPNNLLIDTENGQFNLIDVLDVADFSNYCRKNNLPQIIKPLKKFLKTGILYPMYSLILDSKTQPWFLDNLSSTEKNEIEIISKDVIKKCKIALLNCGYNAEKETSKKTKIIFKLNDILKGTAYARRYQEFIDMYDLN